MDGWMDDSILVDGFLIFLEFKQLRLDERNDETTTYKYKRKFQDKKRQFYSKNSEEKIMFSKSAYCTLVQD